MTATDIEKLMRATKGLTPTPDVPSKNGGPMRVDAQGQGAAEDGQDSNDAQLRGASVEVGQSTVDAHDVGADLHAILGHYARLLWDIQRVRIMVSNRVKAMERDELPVEWMGMHQEVLALLGDQEKAVDRQLAKVAKEHIMADWIKDQRGIALPGFARIVGVTGSFERFATVSKVWKYMGLHVVNGEAPKKRRGQKLDYSPQGRVVAHQIGESIVRAGKGTWRDLYDMKKKYYEDKRPDWSKLRRHRAAMRYAVKSLIKAMWIEWMRRANDQLKPIRSVPATNGGQSTNEAQMTSAP